MIYHITPASEWQAAQVAGRYTADSLTTQGFIHASDIGQVLRVANAIHPGEQDLVLLVIDPTKLEPEVRYERGNPPSLERFPHSYGAINLDAVLAVVPFPPNADGTFRLPDGLIG